MQVFIIYYIEIFDEEEYFSVCSDNIRTRLLFGCWNEHSERIVEFCKALTEGNIPSAAVLHILQIDTIFSDRIFMIKEH